MARNNTNNTLVKGTWNLICDICKIKKKAKDCKKQWDGLMACPNCYDTKHPFLWPRPAVVDGRAVPNARPPQPDVFIDSPNDTSGSVWDVRYWNGSSFVSDLIWDDWDEPWGGITGSPYTPENFPLR